jgi:hypothetical protein
MAIVERAYCNVDQWHAAGLTGTGIKILVYEVGSPTMKNHPDYGGKVKNPLGNCFGNIEQTHMENVVDTALFFAPGISEVILWRDGLTSALQYCLANDIDIMNYSATGGTITPEFDALEEACMANGTFFVCSAGNEGNDGLTTFSRKNSWLSVGAVRMNGGIATRTPYSSYDAYGTDLDVMAFGDLMLPSTHYEGQVKGISGTSFASPAMVGMIACFKQWFFDTNGRKPTWTETYNFVVDNAQDMELEGYDVYTGHGLLIMPELTPSTNKVSLWIGSPTALINGEEVTLNVVPTINEDGFTVVGLRDVGELVGKKVTWINAERRIDIENKDGAENG